MAKQVIQPIIKDLKKTHPPVVGPVPQPASKAPQPAELDQDAGSGYNADGTYPQQ